LFENALPYKKEAIIAATKVLVVSEIKTAEQVAYNKSQPP
jgi:hypothetical protein